MAAGPVHPLGRVRFEDSNRRRPVAQAVAVVDSVRLPVQVFRCYGGTVALSPTAGLAVAVPILVMANLLNNRWARRAYVPTSVATAASLLGVLRLVGLTWSDAGLARADLARGARWAPTLVMLVAVGYLASALPANTRRMFLDRRVEEAGVGSAAYQVLVRIPLGTVALEEVAFRGVLFELLRDRHGAVGGTAISSPLFGLWHVLSARELPTLNPVAGRMFHTRPELVVAPTLAATALAGGVLCELRRQSGSLLAPMALHWASNALGYVTAFVVTRRRRET